MEYIWVNQLAKPASYIKTKTKLSLHICHLSQFFKFSDAFSLFLFCLDFFLSFRLNPSDNNSQQKKINEYKRKFEAQMYRIVYC